MKAERLGDIVRPLAASLTLSLGVFGIAAPEDGNPYVPGNQEIPEDDAQPPADCPTIADIEHRFDVDGLQWEEPDLSDEPDAVNACRYVAAGFTLTLWLNKYNPVAPNQTWDNMLGHDWSRASRFWRPSKDAYVSTALFLSLDGELLPPEKQTAIVRANYRVAEHTLCGANLNMFGIPQGVDTEAPDFQGLQPFEDAVAALAGEFCVSSESPETPATIALPPYNPTTPTHEGTFWQIADQQFEQALDHEPTRQEVYALTQFLLTRNHQTWGTAPDLRAGTPVILATTAEVQFIAAAV